MIFHLRTDGKPHDDSFAVLEISRELHISNRGNITIFCTTDIYRNEYFYDHEGRIIKFQTGGNDYDVIECNYFEGKLYKLSYRYGTLAKKIYSFDYDEKGRLCSVFFEGRLIPIEYDSYGDVKRPY